ncbi:UNVERIFIED_CONTAM: hypothetical protein K2H54_014861, partial [Gekko kuhli]
MQIHHFSGPPCGRIFPLKLPLAAANIGPQLGLQDAGGIISRILLCLTCANPIPSPARGSQQDLERESRFCRPESRK